ncbi:MAG: cytidine deaminase [Spirochaetales bacterium]|nr:cytidine deaminase [Spirochaetales bacterium]
MNAKLIEEAKRALENAYAPYSKFRVGAAILTESGNIYKGCNVENASFGAALCAERTAATSAIAAEGKVGFKEIAIASESEQPAPPCGICRQFLSEFTDPDVPVYLVSVSSGVVKEFTFGKLMPEMFTKF